MITDVLREIAYGTLSMTRECMRRLKKFPDLYIVVTELDKAELDQVLYDLKNPKDLGIKINLISGNRTLPENKAIYRVELWGPKHF